MKTIKLISFDLDGTLTTTAFVDAVWRVGVPELYAAKHKISFGEAQKTILHHYEAMGDNDLLWYNLPFWLTYFELEADAEQLLHTFRPAIALFSDVLPTLSFLQQRRPLIMISNAARIFLNMEVQATGIEKYFKKIFSVTTDFKTVKRDAAVYRTVCSHMNIDPQEIMHVGDHWEFDFETPRRIGMQAYFVDRAGSKTGDSIIYSLDELKEIVND